MKRIIVFGAGERLNILEKEGYLDNYEVLAICDNDIKKRGRYFKEYEIINPDCIQDFNYDEIWISSNKYYSLIKNQLIIELGIDENVINKFEIVSEKYRRELGFWKDVYSKEGFSEAPSLYYKKLILAIAEEKSDIFWKNKIVADFGCGPRGSLAWTDSPSVKIGIDVLSAEYLNEFGEEMISHNMIYVTSNENKIPIPSGFVDYVITINSLDHVMNLDEITRELLRILKPQGTLIASFNLNEPYVEHEPQTLTEEILQEKLLDNFDIESY